MKHLLILAVLVLVLASCTSAQKAFVGQSVEAVKQAKDAEAALLKVSVCAMSIGAYHRVNNATERQALDVLCGGDWARPVTADDVRALRDLGNLLRSE